MLVSEILSKFIDKKILRKNQNFDNADSPNSNEDFSSSINPNDKIIEVTDWQIKTSDDDNKKQ